MKQEYIQTIITDPQFLNFLDKEFRATAHHATIEELAEFAFGSVEEAVERYDKLREKK